MKMTRNEMSRVYPNQWIGINNILYRDGKRNSIEEADVIYTDKSASELAMMILNGEDVVALYTTPDNCFHVGALM